MIFLHTGLPGAGKTLYTLAHLKPLAESEGRQVYYFGIPDLRVPGWIELTEDQALAWFDLPAGAIIVVDEAQKLFRPRGAGAKVPDHVARLETHRHHGHDLYLITQHPGLIDQNVRKLVGTHRHVVRSFGAKFSMIHQWGQCKDNCDKSRSDSMKSQFRYPKEVFSWYKSAEVHTHRMHLPWRLFLLAGLVIFIPWAGYSVYKGLVLDPVAKYRGDDETLQSGAYFQGQGAVQNQNRPLTSEEYVDSLTPRLEGLPHTAPRYDQITQPQTAPYPAGCVLMRDQCKCYTDQGTLLSAVPESVCRNVLAHGFYKDWGDQDRSGKLSKSAHAQVAASSAENVHPGAGGRVVLIGDSGTYGGVPPPGR